MKQSELVDYYNVWGPSRFRARDGRPLSEETLAEKIPKFNLPVIETGNSALIDPVQGDDRLREYAQKRRSRR